uniref:Solute carrier family 47 member 2 n=1 Tax=Anolis carolinensis TaxID=28377 RepID=A0A803T6S3_ANOCA
MCIILTATKDVLAYIFTSDAEVIELVAWVMPVYIAFHLFEALSATTSGILRGTGKQKLGAIFNAVGYYAVGLPVGIVLIFVAKIGLIGLWVGMLVCALIPSTFSIAYIAKMNWKQVAEEAQHRAGLTPKPMTTMTEDSNSTPGPTKTVPSIVGAEGSHISGTVVMRLQLPASLGFGVSFTVARLQLPAFLALSLGVALVRVGLQLPALLGSGDRKNSSIHSNSM